MPSRNRGQIPDLANKISLAAGSGWTDAWTGEIHDRGGAVRADAPLHQIPLFLRNGASLPISGSPGSHARGSRFPGNWQVDDALP